MEMSVLALIIWGEITFLLAGGLALLLANQWLSKRKQSKASQVLLQKVKTDRQQRLDEIRQGLSAYGLEGELLEEKVAEIDKQELKLYQRLVNMFRSRSDGMLSKINLAVEASTKPYYELDISLESSKSSDEAANQASPAAQGEGELDALQKKNQELELELGVAMETIGRMLSEYSSLFGSDNDEDNELDKNKIMQAFNAEESADEAESLESAEVSEQEEVVEVAEDTVSDEESVSQDDEINTEELLEIDDELLEEAATEEEELDVVVEDQLDEVEPGLSEAEPSISEAEQEAVDNADDLSGVSITDITEEMLGSQDDVAEENEESPDSNFVDNVEEDLLGAVSLDDEDIAELEAAGLTDLVDADHSDEQASEDEEVEVTDLDELDIEKILAENKEK